MRAVFLRAAEDDLIELRRYIIKGFGNSAWLDTFDQIKRSVRTLTDFPMRGDIPDELAELGLSQYRQVISGKNRIIYEIRDQAIYIHVVCDARREMRKLLSRRLLRIVG